MAKGTCSAADCERPSSARGLCPSHYQRQRLLDPARPGCSQPECTRRAYARGLCRRHYCDAALPGYWTEYDSRPDVKARSAAKHQDRRAANPEAFRAKSRATYARNPARAVAASQRWKQQHPERTQQIRRADEAARRARKRSTQAEPIDLALVLADHGMTCHICGGDIVSLGDLHFDHVIPLAHGGTHTYDNLRPAHATCNLRKGAAMPA